MGKVNKYCYAVIVVNRIQNDSWFVISTFQVILSLILEYHVMTL